MKEGHADVVMTLLEARDVVNKPNELIVALMHAIRFQQLQIITVLLEYNDRLDEAYKNVEDILMHAIRFGEANVVELLLEHKSKFDTGEVVDEADDLMTSALMSACLRGKADIVGVLLDAGADVNARDPETGETPLMLAICHDQFDVVNLLLERKASVNATYEHGQTALMRASKCGHHHIAELLIMHGAYVDQVDHSGMMTASNFAKNDDVTSVLQRAREIHQSKTSIHEKDIVMLLHKSPMTLMQARAWHASPQIWV